MNIRPVGDRVLIRKLDEPRERMTRGGLHVPDTAGLEPVKASRGIVIAVGDWPFVPALHVGEVVVFMQYAGCVTDDGLILKADEVLGVEFEAE